MVLSLFLYVILFYGLLAHAQSLIQLPFIPLAVKTPYLNAWSLNSAAPPTGWSQFFTNDKVSARHLLGRNTLISDSDSGMDVHGSR
jgi:hypothetical protein